MSLKQLVRVNVGEVGILPGTVKMVSTDSLATITTAGYLNGVNNGNIVSGVQLSPTDVIECLYSFNDSTGSCSFTLLRPTFSNGVITLNADAGSEGLTSGHIFVGNSANVATDVALSGDATLSNTGVLTIAANAITTTKILAANVTLAKLAAGITPAYVSKFGGQAANGGGSPTIVLSVTGLTTSHVCLANVQASANAVSVQKVTPTSNTLTILLSGDPGAGTIISYQAFLAAA